MVGVGQGIYPSSVYLHLAGIVVAACSCASASSPGSLHDLLIAGGTVLDGTGEPDVRADVVVRGDRIVGVGLDLGPARDTLDATGLVVAPGFIDMPAIPSSASSPTDGRSPRSRRA